jgi:hypothetical protein
MKQITVSEYLKLTDLKRLEYDLLLPSLKAKQWLTIEINSLTYNEVKSIYKLLQKATEIKDIEKVFDYAFKMSTHDFYNLPITKYFQLKKYISDYFVVLHKKESDLLNSISADIGIWQQAGGDSLNEFSDVLPLSQLAKIYGGYPFDYGQKKYVEIVYLLRMNNVQSQVENEYQKLKNGRLG